MSGEVGISFRIRSSRAQFYLFQFHLLGGCPQAQTYKVPSTIILSLELQITINCIPLLDAKVRDFAIHIYKEKNFDLSTRFCFKDSSFTYTSGSGGNDEVPEILSHKHDCSIKFGRRPRQLFKFDRFTQIVYNRLLIHLIHYYTPLVLFQID